MNRRSYTSLLAAALTLVFAGSVFSQTCPGSPGCLDTTFNGTGKQLVAVAPNGASQHDVVVQSDGKIVSLHDERSTGVTLIRLNADGSLDPGFGSNGVVTTNWHFSPTLPTGYPYGLAIQTVNGEERLVVAGSWTVPQGKRSSITELRVDRYLPNGSIDTSFGTNGTVLVDKSPAIAVAIQPADQKIVTVGGDAVVRLNVNGTVDASFGPNGDGATGAGQSGWSILALPSGKILIGGTYSQKNADVMCVSALNLNGSVDTTFGSAGRAIANFYGSGSFGRAFRIALDPFGNIVAGGIARPKGASIAQNVYAGARFTMMGQLDTSFNGTGMVTYNFAGLDNTGRGIVAQSDGKVVLTGSADLAAGVQDIALVRFNFNGTVDTSFGNNGRVTTDISGDEYSYSSRIWLDPTCSCEKIIVAAGGPAGASYARYTTQ